MPPRFGAPHTSDNIKEVEMVQRRAARYVCNHWHNTSSVCEMVGHLGWESIAIRHNYIRLHMMYRITHAPAGDAWQRWLMPSTRQTCGFYPWRYIPLSPSNVPYKFSFLPSTIPAWNNLPPHVVSSPTLHSFRRQLTARFFNFTSLGGDLLFLPSLPAAHFVSALTRTLLLGLFPNICSMHTGPWVICLVIFFLAFFSFFNKI